MRISPPDYKKCFISAVSADENLPIRSAKLRAGIPANMSSCDRRPSPGIREEYPAFEDECVPERSLRKENHHLRSLYTSGPISGLFPAGFGPFSPRCTF